MDMQKVAATSWITTAFDGGGGVHSHGFASIYAKWGYPCVATKYIYSIYLNICAQGSGANLTSAPACRTHRESCMERYPFHIFPQSVQ